MPDESVLKLKASIVVARVLLAIAKGGRPGYPNPDVCLYLADRYSRLAEYYRRARKFKNSDRLRRKAKEYFAGIDPGSGPDPSYPAALAMPASKRPSLVAAISERSRKGPPDNAA